VRPGRETDHFLSSSAEVKNTWSYTSTSQYVFTAFCLAKYRIPLHWVFSSSNSIDIKLGDIFSQEVYSKTKCRHFLKDNSCFLD